MISTHLLYVFMTYQQKRSENSQIVLCIMARKIQSGQSVNLRKERSKTVLCSFLIHSTVVILSPMKIFAAYLLVSVALASGMSEDASLRGASDDLAADVNVERDLKNACKNSDVKYNTYSGKKCFSKCACDACQERGGGLCCNASCNPQVGGEN